MNTEHSNEEMLNAVLQKSLTGEPSLEDCITVYKLSAPNSSARTMSMEKIFETLDHQIKIDNIFKSMSKSIKNIKLKPKEVMQLIERLIFADDWEECITIYKMAPQGSFPEIQAQKKFLLYLDYTSSFIDAYEMYLRAPEGSYVQEQALLKAFGFIKRECE